MICHQFIVDNWWFFSDFFPFPYVATIGVGENFHSVCINNERELHSFLLSPDSMKCWIDSQIDHSVIANMFGINVFTYVYNCQDSPPVWQMTSPDPILTNYMAGSWNDGTIEDIILYHAVNTHYDLLISRSSSLALFGPVSERITELLEAEFRNTTDINLSINLSDISVTPMMKKILSLII